MTKSLAARRLYLFGIVFTYSKLKIYFDEVSLSWLLVRECGSRDRRLLLCTLRMTEALISLQWECTRTEECFPDDFSPWRLP
jgi:hypothetical protein